MSSGTIQRPAINPWFVALTLTLATFMDLLDTSIANVSLPYIAGGMGRSFDEVTWILTTYLVANAVVLPMSAWFSRAFGRKNYYMTCVALFTVTSFFCGIAPTLSFILVARVLQGMGGSGLAPVEQAILVDTFPPAKRAAAFALYTIAVATAPALGPVLGGWITDNYNWRWIFFINIPVGILSLILTSRYVHDSPAFQKERDSVRVNGKLTIDGIGVALIGIGSAALELLLDRGQIDDWFDSPFICWMFAIGVICLCTAIWWELHTPNPIVDLRLLKIRNFAIACCFYFVFAFSLFGSTALIPQLLQSLYGYSAVDAGFVIAPGATVVTCVAPLAARLLQRGIIKAKHLLFAGVMVVGNALLHYSRFTLQTDYHHYALARALQGLGYGCMYVSVSVIAYSQLGPGQNDKASSLTNVFRNWGGSFGIAFITTMAERRQSFHQERIGSNLDRNSLTLQSAIRSTADYLQVHGIARADAIAMATAHYYDRLHAQARMLAYMDCFRLIGITVLVLAPLSLLTVAAKPRAKVPEGSH